MTFFEVNLTIMKRLTLLLLLACSHAPWLFASDPGAAQGERILFLGNSITLHGPAPEIGWNGNWGMAASSPEHDYVHLLTAKLAGDSGQKPHTMVRNIANFERNYATFNVAEEFQNELQFKADIVIVAIGENVSEPQSDADKQQFATAFRKLLRSLSEQGTPNIIVRSSFWPNTTKDDIMRTVTREAGATFVDISEIGRNPDNAARAERAIAHKGVAAHPGDKGMQEIADALWNAIKQTSRSVRNSPTK